MSTTATSTEARVYLGELNAFQLARTASVSAPDSLESPGAKFLHRVADTVADSFDEIVSADDPSDLVFELSDGCVSIYTHVMWEEFVDLCAYGELCPDIEIDPSIGISSLASATLQRIAERLIYALLAELGVEL